MLKKLSIVAAVVVALVGGVYAYQQWQIEPNRSPQALTDCDPSETASLVFAGKRVPERLLYRYGKKEISDMNVAADTVPNDAWNESVMGDHSRFNLKRFRRGLYGTEALDTADRFGHKPYDELTVITLKQSCLTPERTETIWNLPANERFQEWYLGKKFSLSLKAWAEICYLPSGAPLSEQFKYYEAKTTDESSCELIVNQYFTDLNFAAVQDTVVRRSWAIRDRDCIEHIQGGSEYWARAFLMEPKLWKNQCERASNHRVRARVWFRSLGDEKTDLMSDASFQNALVGIERPASDFDPLSGEFDDFAVQDFAKSFDEARIRCQRRRKTKELKALLMNLADAVDSLQSLDVKNELERLCR